MISGCYSMLLTKIVHLKVPVLLGLFTFFVIFLTTALKILCKIAVVTKS